jgi:YHS domain-containing protein
MAKDPICGMTVDEATALHADRDGQTFYFCSEHCRNTFQPAPATKKQEEKEKGQKSKVIAIYTLYGQKIQPRPDVVLSHKDF